MLKPVVDIEGLSFTYSGSAVPALEGINLQVYPGQFITITGPSGCGKSTLALCLAGFIPHAYGGRMEGVVRIQGKNTRDYPAGGLSGIVGLVQQDPEAQLCTLTVNDEVAFGPENLCIPSEEIQERVYSALQAVGALSLKDRKVHTLSGGEKQRVAIASVLAMNPSLLILDEPTANLDPSCAREVLDTLRRLKEQQEISIIVIEHRLERLLPISDRLLLMQEGKLAEEKTPETVDHIYVPAPVKAQSEAGVLPGKISNEMPAHETPILTVKSLTAGYEGRDVISGISFRAYPGETIAIMGDNGSGKTTLLLTMLGILKPRKGAVYLQGNDITRHKVSRRAQDMGLTFQNPNHQIFEDTVLKEAILASRFLGRQPPQETEQEVDRLLEKFGLRQYINRNPFTLSLGEKKRLTLVSVLAYSPKVLILDEPLVGQDRDRLDLLINALREHGARGGITLMVCHEPNVIAACCQRVLFLSEGKLIIDAPVGEAMERLAQWGWEEYLPSGYELSTVKETVNQDGILS
jgi:energy-coupling factor transporter ATP-binding protein EcfA2